MEVRPARPPRLGAKAALLQPAHQVRQALLQSVRKIRIARADGYLQLTGLLHHADFHFLRARRSHLKRDVLQRRGRGFGNYRSGRYRRS